MAGSVQVTVLFFFLAFGNVVCKERAQYEFDVATIKTPYDTYQVGVDLGIINPEKYSFTDFKRDEQNVFQTLYNEYISINSSLPATYEKWLILNNFGILTDTQESLFEKKISKRSAAEKRYQFINTVKKGDILITGRGSLYPRLKRSGGSFSTYIGHTALMSSDDEVLEMAGGDKWIFGISDNNQKVPADEWFDQLEGANVQVYRCPDISVARQAADWAYRNYYNPSGGPEKTVHVYYNVIDFDDISSTNPSYCSKLVIQAYYFGSGSKKVIKDVASLSMIVPVNIPSYFLYPYELVSVGKY